MSHYKFLIEFVNDGKGFGSSGYRLIYHQGGTDGFSIIINRDDVFNSNGTTFRYCSGYFESEVKNDIINVGGFLEPTDEKCIESLILSFDTMCNTVSEKICLYYALYDFCRFVIIQKENWYFKSSGNCYESTDEKKKLYRAAFLIREKINEKINSYSEIFDRLKLQLATTGDAVTVGLNTDDKLAVLKLCTIRKKNGGSDPKCIIGGNAYSLQKGGKFSLYELGWASETILDSASLPSLALVNAPNSLLHGGIYSVVNCKTARGKRYYGLMDGNGEVHSMSEDHLELYEM